MEKCLFEQSKTATGWRSEMIKNQRKASCDNAERFVLNYLICYNIRYSYENTN
jgi:hypothetical protein